MAVDRRIDIKRKWPIPANIKMILMLLVIFGLLLSKCWHDNKASNILITEIKINNVTKVSAEVSFVVANRASVELTKTLKIGIYTKSGELIADKLTNVTIPKKSHKNFLKILQKFNFPLEDSTQIGEIIVEVYK